MSNESDDSVLLYSYWRSSSAYRVRIALNLKQIGYRQKYIHLVRDGGEQNTPGYRAINPLGLVPALVHRDRTIVQSMAICEYLEEAFPAHPLLPEDPAGRARVRGIAQSIASEIQPLNNLGVTNRITSGTGFTRIKPPSVSGMRTGSPGAFPLSNPGCPIPEAVSIATVTFQPWRIVSWFPRYTTLNGFPATLGPFQSSGGSPANAGLCPHLSGRRLATRRMQSIKGDRGLNSDARMRHNHLLNL